MPDQDQALLYLVIQPHFIILKLTAVSRISYSIASPNVFLFMAHSKILSKFRQVCRIRKLGSTGGRNAGGFGSATNVIGVTEIKNRAFSFHWLMPLFAHLGFFAFYTILFFSWNRQTATAECTEKLFYSSVASLSFLKLC